MILRRWLQIGAGVMLGLVIAGYTAYQFQDWWRGPTITIESPENGSAFEKPLINISGTAQRIAYLSFNGRQIYTNPEGEFAEPLLLSPGYNIITVSARDKFSRTTEKQLQLMLSVSTTTTNNIYE